VSAAFCVAALLVACTPSSSPTPNAGTGPPGSSEPAPSPSAEAAPAEAEDPAWKTFTTPDGKLMFDYPPDWTVQDRAREATPGGIFVDVLDADGKSMATLRTNLAAKAECARKYPYALMDSESLPALAQKGVAPRFVFEGRDDHGPHPSKPAPLSYGITSAALPSGRSACPIFQFFTWPPGAAAFSGVYNAVATPPGVTPDVNTPEAYTATDEYDAVRQTITSLRPAD
jgi:hypothetical protein